MNPWVPPICRLKYLLWLLVRLSVSVLLSEGVFFRLPILVCLQNELFALDFPFVVLSSSSRSSFIRSGRWAQCLSICFSVFLATNSVFCSKSVCLRLGSLRFLFMCPSVATKHFLVPLFLAVHLSLAYPINRQLFCHTRNIFPKSQDFINKPGGISLSKVERSTDQVIKPVNLEALSKWVGKVRHSLFRWINF